MIKNLKLELTDSESTLLQDTAQRLGVSPQQLARTTIVDALNRLQTDSQFREVVQTVLTKNAELYQRLAK